MPLIAKAKRHDGMGSALHSRAPRKLAGRWQLPPHPFYRTQPVKSAAYNERLGPRVAGGGSYHRGNTKGTPPSVPEAYSTGPGCTPTPASSGAADTTTLPSRAARTPPIDFASPLPTLPTPPDQRPNPQP